MLTSDWYFTDFVRLVQELTAAETGTNKDLQQLCSHVSNILLIVSMCSAFNRRILLPTSVLYSSQSNSHKVLSELNECQYVGFKGLKLSLPLKWIKARGSTSFYFNACWEHSSWRKLCQIYLRKKYSVNRTSWQDSNPQPLEQNERA